VLPPSALFTVDSFPFVNYDREKFYNTGPGLEWLARDKPGNTKGGGGKYHCAVDLLFGLESAV
jgi:hypothetical protein